MKLKEFYKKLAKENQRKGGKRKKALSKKDKVDKWGVIANEASVSRQFAIDVDYVLEHGTAKEKKELEDIRRSMQMINIAQLINLKNNNRKTA